MEVTQAFSSRYDVNFPAPNDHPSSRPPISRRIPPMGMADTFYVTDTGSFDPNNLQSEHPIVTIFSDDEILRVFPLSEERLSEGVPVATIVANGKTVIQQQGRRGCTAAAASMLIVDHGKRPNKRYLVRTNIGFDASIIRAIKAAGLEPLMQEIPTTFTALQQAIRQHGPALVTINDPSAGGHQIVVDDIVSDCIKSASIREPYHGLAIEVPWNALEKRFIGPTCSIIQIP